MRLRAAGVVASAVDTVEASVVALISAALAAPISAVLAPVSLAALRVSTSPRSAATSATKGISAVGVSCRALATASMTTTTGAATATRTTQLTAAIRPPIRPRTTSREHRARYHDHAAYE